jgi:ribonuclease HI
MPPKQPPKPLTAVKKYYAIRVGRHPGIYITWPEAQKEVSGFTGAVYKSFTTLPEAQEYMHTAVSKLRAPDPTAHKPLGATDLEELLGTDLTDVDSGGNPQTEADQFIPHLRTCQGDDESAYSKSTPDEWTRHQGEFYLATDGSFNTKSRRSGWAVYLGRQASNLVQKMPLDTTNNRCELLAIQAALGCVLAHLGHPQLTTTGTNTIKPVINIVTDSQLCVNTFTKWITAWKKKGWRLASGEEPKNLQEVQEIDRQLSLIRNKGIRVEFIHQRAHTSGTELRSKSRTQKDRMLWQINYVVDALAQQLTN